jgi:hypothetical protein
MQRQRQPAPPRRRALRRYAGPRPAAPNEHLRGTTLGQRLRRRTSATGPCARIADPAGDQNQARAAGADPPRTRASRTTICRRPTRD